MPQSPLPLPDRTLRRQPTEVEIRAAVDFRKLDQMHDTGSDQTVAWLNKIVPEQIAQLMEQVTAAAGKGGKLSKPKAAALRAPVLGVEELTTILLDMAQGGAATAAAEAAAQGVPITEAVPEKVLKPIVAAQAQAVADLHAQSLSLAAGRKATQLTTGRSAAQIASDLGLHLQTFQHTWTQDQLKGAVQMAMNVGRLQVMDRVEAPKMFAASELLDSNTCDPCYMIDGTEWDSIVDAQAEYGSGGYVDCDGGPRCRGTIVAVYDELGGGA